MKKLIFLLFIFLISCTIENEEKIEYYKVINFKVGDVVNINIHGYRYYTGKGRIYYIDLINENGDTISQKIVTNKSIRFIQGDTVFFRYGTIYLKDNRNE